MLYSSLFSLQIRHHSFMCEEAQYNPFVFVIVFCGARSMSLPFLVYTQVVAHLFFGNRIVAACKGSTLEMDSDAEQRLRGALAP
jgi:hypothetical protein